MKKAILSFSFLLLSSLSYTQTLQEPTALRCQNPLVINSQEVEPSKHTVLRTQNPEMITGDASKNEAPSSSRTLITTEPKKNPAIEAEKN